MAERPDRGWMGYGVDVGASARPGVPRERRVTGEGNRGELAEPQRGPGVLSRSGLRMRTPVFGTAQPARGLAGSVRRAAYRLPEHRAGRWALLLAADRLDVVAHRARRGWWLIPTFAAVVVGYAVAARAARRS